MNERSFSLHPIITPFPFWQHAPYSKAIPGKNAILALRKGVGAEAQNGIEDTATDAAQFRSELEEADAPSISDRR
jgi:hypothetical protein